MRGRQLFRLALALGAATVAIAPAEAQRAGRGRQGQLGPNFAPPGLNGGLGGRLGGGLRGGTGQGGTEINGFVDVRQRLTYITGRGGGNFRAATVVGGGGTAAVDRDRFQLGAAGALQYSIGMAGQGRDRLIGNGIARGSVEAIRDTLTFTGTGFAALANQRFGGAGTIDPLEQDPDGFAQIFGITGAANFNRPVGDRLQVRADYQYSFIDVSGIRGGQGSGVGGLAGGVISDSVSQFADVSIGMIPGVSRLTLTANGTYTHNEQDLLQQRFENYSGTLDAAYSVNPEISLLGSVGWQDYLSTRQAILSGPDFLSAPNGLRTIPLTGSLADPNLFFRTLPGAAPGPVPVFDFLASGLEPPLLFPGATGFLLNGINRTQSLDDPALVFTNSAAGPEPVLTGFGPLLDATGRFIPDLAAPRDTLFRQRGIVWNAGARYSPDPRLLMELRVGQRFQQVTVTGVVNYQVRRNVIFNAQLTDGIETFGTILTRIVNGVPVSVVRGGRGGGLFGGAGLVGGGALDGQIQSISAGVFRSRIASMALTIDKRRVQLGAGVTYNQRDFMDRGQTPGPGGLPIDPTLANRSDRSILGDVTLTRGSGRGSGISASVGGGWFDRNLFGQPESYVVRGALRANRAFNPRLQGIASLAATQQFADRRADTQGFFGFPQGNRLLVVISGGVRYLF